MGERIDNKGAWQMPQGGVKLGKNEGLLMQQKENFLKKQELKYKFYMSKQTMALLLFT